MTFLYHKNSQTVGKFPRNFSGKVPSFDVGLCIWLLDIQFQNTTLCHEMSIKAQIKTPSAFTQ